MNSVRRTLTRKDRFGKTPNQAVQAYYNSINYRENPLFYSSSIVYSYVSQQLAATPHMTTDVSMNGSFLSCPVSVLSCPPMVLQSRLTVHLR